MTKLVMSQQLDSFQVSNDGNVGINSKYKKLPSVAGACGQWIKSVMQHWQHWQ